LLGIVGSDSSDDGCERMKGAEREKRGSEASASFESNRMEYATFSYMFFFFFSFCRVFLDFHVRVTCHWRWNPALAEAGKKMVVKYFIYTIHILSEKV